ncbi:MAG: glycosyltransferase family 39 protein [Desulfuromonadaceae bacterium]|nr:glycosyltransferase family 39 protein [Desulfuromonadaceae bacterium]MDD2855771.1 glycosyltransferase family 39 protein [Desulfuromonadaceae bacterium]
MNNTKTSSSGLPTQTVAWTVRFVLPALLCTIIFTIIIATIADYGLTQDEPYYIENARAIEYWFSHAAESSSSFTYDTIYKYWRSGILDDKLSGNVHPPFFKLSAIAFRHLIGVHIFDNIVFQYRISTAFWTAMLVLSLFLITRRMTGSSLWGLMAGLSFIAVPRFFAEAHLFTTDMMITALGFCGLTAFLLAKSSRAKILLGGALFGAALATKFTGILAIAIVAPLVMIADNRKRFLLDYALMVLTACAFFCFFNFPILFNPQEELRFYFANFFSREKLVPLSTLYFGTLYGFRVPFHHPWVMLGITLPPLTIFAALLGLFAGTAEYIKKRNRFAFLALAPFLICMSAYMLPSTPKHDGIRLFSTVWPFIILLGIVGLSRIQNLLSPKFNVGIIVCSMSIFLALFQLMQFHPLQLSYYNSFIGGTKGAERNGFVVAYWPECFNRDFFSKAFKILGDKDGKIFLYPPTSMVTYNKSYGLFTTNLENTYKPEDDYRYMLILNRVLTPEMLQFLETRKKLLEVKAPDGSFIGGLFENR